MHYTTAWGGWMVKDHVVYRRTRDGRVEDWLPHMTGTGWQKLEDAVKIAQEILMDFTDGNEWFSERYALTFALRFLSGSSSRWSIGVGDVREWYNRALAKLGPVTRGVNRLAWK